MALGAYGGALEKRENTNVQNCIWVLSSAFFYVGNFPGHWWLRVWCGMTMTAQVAWGWEDPATSPPSWVDPAAPSPLCLSRKCLASSAGSKLSTERSLEPFIVMIIVMIDYFWRPISEEPGVLTMAYGYMLISSHTSTHMHTLSLSLSLYVCLSLSLSLTHTHIHTQWHSY